MGVFFCDPAGFIAANDVVCYQQNFLEGEITLLEPGPKPNGRRRTTLLSSNPLFTSPTEIVGHSGIRGPRHISTSGITLHRTPKEADILKILNGVVLVTEQVGQK